jgi:hypothetical protein
MMNHLQPNNIINPTQHDFLPQKSTDIRKNLFAKRVINDRNKLPMDVKTAQDTNTFKISQDKYFQDVKKTEMNLVRKKNRAVVAERSN